MHSRCRRKMGWVVAFRSMNETQQLLFGHPMAGGGHVGNIYKQHLISKFVYILYNGFPLFGRRLVNNIIAIRLYKTEHMDVSDGGSEWNCDCVLGPSVWVAEPCGVLFLVMLRAPCSSGTWKYCHQFLPHHTHTYTQTLYLKRLFGAMWTGRSVFRAV